MKKLLFFSAIALMFTIFSCTPDEFETQPKQETKKTINPAKDTFADDGPGDDGTKNPPPPTTPPPADE
ncbi:hypothetical protein EYY60_13505 [Flavobacterium zhairuonense]|uniref:hypothetical protein n=1 Tax=Flavobacterium zhairuonense TaxID=2493631 RepID=UPI00104F5FC8|nr:hypothetical protein [Flavobacterium zhairuonense]KAF2509153.1 hypothetical protein EYY60_13505 [Flavobacterium zhairuonense]